MTLKTNPGARAATVIVAASIAVILVVSLWYLARPQPLIVQGEADATRVDIAARHVSTVSVATRPVHRGEDVNAGQVLVTIHGDSRAADAPEGGRGGSCGRRRRSRARRRISTPRSSMPAGRLSRRPRPVPRLAEQNYDRTQQLTSREFA